MADIIGGSDLASYLRDPSLAENDSLLQIVGWVNELIAEEWTEPADPIPVRVTILALNVGARAWVNNPVAGNLISTSVAIDDGSTTERYRTPSRMGVYLTADEVATLNGERRLRSVRLVNYGQT